MKNFVYISITLLMMALWPLMSYAQEKPAPLKNNIGIGWRYNRWIAGGPKFRSEAEVRYERFIRERHLVGASFNLDFRNLVSSNLTYTYAILHGKKFQIWVGLAFYFERIYSLENFPGEHFDDHCLQVPIEFRYLLNDRFQAYAGANYGNAIPRAGILMRF